MCFNKKVVAGLAATALAVLAVAPNLFGAALPFLVMAACPLSMTLMMRRMGGQAACHREPAARSEAAAPVNGTAESAELQTLRDEVARLRAEQPRMAGSEVTAAG